MVRLEAGKKYDLVFKRKDHLTKQDTIEVVRATVNWVEEREGGQYFGYTPDDDRFGKFGAAWNRPVPNPYGLQEVQEVVS
jgi:hypothetical protein